MNGREMARVLQVSEATVSRLVSGDRQPSLELMVKIKSVLNWKLDPQAEALQSGKYGEVFAEKMAKKKAPTPRIEGASMSLGIVDEVSEWPQPSAS